MAFTFSKATRKNVPLLISLAGVSGSGKTYSALLLAAGLAGDRPVAFLDTENGRGSMYADSPGIMAALPNGYDVGDMQEPFSPGRFSEAVDDAARAGCAVLVIDSFTHEWEGFGGCSDIAENNKLRGMPNWAKAKLEHKRMMNHLLAAPMHIIFCLRAREKVKVVKADNGKEQVVPIGLQAIQEKNFIFEMTLSLLLDEVTHVPEVTKCPEPLLPLFAGQQSRITKDMGRKLLAWAESGATAVTTEDGLFEQAKLYAGEGLTAYSDYWNGLSATQKKVLLPKHEENKKLAINHDQAALDESRRAEEQLLQP